MGQPHLHRFVALDSLRGVAAVLVALYHLDAQGWLTGASAIRHGGMFVDFFFVLSGFVIASAYGEKLIAGHSIRTFLALRMGRLYPLYIVAVAGSVAYGVAMTLHAHGPFYADGVLLTLGSPVDLALSVVMLQSLRIPSPEAWAGQGWSISVEMILYIAIALAWRRLGGRVWRLAPLLALAVLLVSAVLDEAAFESLNSAVLRGIAGFGLGTGCWRLHQMRRHDLADRATVAPLATLVEAAALATAWAIVSLPAFHGKLLLADFAFAAVVLVFARESGPISRLLRTPAFTWGGTLSYSIYMVHPLIESGLSVVMWRTGLAARDYSGIEPRQWLLLSLPLRDAFALTALAIIVAVAWMAWRWIEEPVRTWSRAAVAHRAGRPDRAPANGNEAGRSEAQA